MRFGILAELADNQRVICQAAVESSLSRSGRSDPPPAETSRDGDPRHDHAHCGPSLHLAGGRTYRGGISAANAARTVFRAKPDRRAIALIPKPSDRCNRRTSAQSSNLITPTL